MFGPIGGSAGVGPLGSRDADAATRSAAAGTTAHTLAEGDVFTIPLTGPDLIHPHLAGTDLCRVKPDC